MELSKSDYEEMGVKRIPRKKKKALKKKIDRLAELLLAIPPQHGRTMQMMKLLISQFQLRV